MTTPTHVLLVDDDEEILELLSESLEIQGLRTSTATDAARAREVLAAQSPDLIVLDLMLPGESGLDFCRSLRQSSGIPIIMLTAMGETVDRIVGLELGADDYMPKPFDPRELVSRIRAVLRRGGGETSAATAAPRSYRFEGWTLDTGRRSLTGPEGSPATLRGAEFDLLELLLSKAGEVATRDWLTDAIRGREHDPFERSIDVRISRLRQLLGDDAKAPRIIKTVYGRGYVISVPVEVGR